MGFAKAWIQAVLQSSEDPGNSRKAQSNREGRGLPQKPKAALLQEAAD